MRPSVEWMIGMIVGDSDLPLIHFPTFGARKGKRDPTSFLLPSHFCLFKGAKRLFFTTQHHKRHLVKEYEAKRDERADGTTIKPNLSSSYTIFFSSCSLSHFLT